MEMNSEAFLVKNNSWNIRTTSNFKFYFDTSLDKAITKSVMKSQKDNYSYITSLMGISKEQYPKITYFLFKDKEQKKLLTNLGTDAHAIAPNVYYLPKNAKGKQEVGHVITQTVWGFIPKTSEFALLIDEGFNYYVDNDIFYNGKLDEYARDYISKTPNFSIINLTTNGKGKRNSVGGHKLKESYVAGSFVKFLITTYGVDKFGRLWKSAVTNTVPNFMGIYGKSLKSLGNKYLKTIS